MKTSIKLQLPLKKGWSKEVLRLMLHIVELMGWIYLKAKYVSDFGQNVARGGGIEICKSTRGNGNHTQFLCLLQRTNTARQRFSESLDAGADGIMLGCFAFRGLLARWNVQTPKQRISNVLKFADLS